jgi:protoheme IX farnesyltransferase
LGSCNPRPLESPDTLQADPKDDVATSPLTTDAVSVPRRERRRTLGRYVALTKPRIIELLLVTTVPVMFLAERGVPSLGLVLATLVGGALSAGAANTFNSVYDRDIDRLMHRTSTRPMVTGEVTPRNGLVFGAALAVVSTVWFVLAVNVLSAVLSVVAIALYAVGYTVLLKRRTSQNIVWGGVAGCMPTLIGWSAVTGTVGWPAVVLFLVIFFWTPPHYWPLSMAFRDDYSAAGVPMLPVERGPVAVGRQIVVYSWLMVATSVLLVPVAQMGWVYATTALLSGGLFLAEAHRLLRAAGSGLTGLALRPMRLFHYSITYVTVLFLAVAVDPLLHVAIG